MKKEQIIVDFLAFLELSDCLVEYIRLTTSNYPGKGVIGFLRRIPPQSFIDTAFSWPNTSIDFWSSLNNLWKARYTKKFTR